MSAILEKIQANWEFRKMVKAKHMPWLIEQAEKMDKLIKIKQAADGGDALLSCQGQGMDGYSELANYRSIIE